MTLNSIAKIFKLLLLALSLSALTACASNDGAKPDSKAGGNIVGVNYTTNYIHQFYIDDSWGGNIYPFSGGGGSVCCVMYTRKWTPDLKVQVKWTTSNGDPKSNDATETWHNKSAPIPEFTEPGEVYVLFFPKDEVRVYITNVGIGSKDFPGNPGYPSHYNPEKNK
jgi:hypothetical protein